MYLLNRSDQPISRSAAARVENRLSEYNANTHIHGEGEARETCMCISSVHLHVQTRLDAGVHVLVRPGMKMPAGTCTSPCVFVSTCACGRIHHAVMLAFSRPFIWSPFLNRLNLVQSNQIGKRLPHITDQIGRTRFWRQLIASVSLVSMQGSAQLCQATTDPHLAAVPWPPPQSQVHAQLLQHVRSSSAVIHGHSTVLAGMLLG